MNYNKPRCIGTGLLALDIITNGDIKIKKVLAGGSCGNVLTILSYLGWDSFPIARLARNEATEVLIQDLMKWGVHLDFLIKEDSGSTPIIIQRNYKDKKGNPNHRFEFKCPESGRFLPRYKPFLTKSIEEFDSSKLVSDFFYFDRVKRSSIEFAKICKSNGATIYFEPTSISDEKLFSESIEIADIIKFSNERIRNYEKIYPHFFENKLEIITLGKWGLKFRYNSDSWVNIPSLTLENIVDSSGSGDWTSAFFINYLFEKELKINNSSFVDQKIIKKGLSFSQAMGALNCYFEGARGVMYELKDKQTLLTYLTELIQNSLNQIQRVNNYQYLDSQICKLFET
jgi:fructokinase